MNSAAGGYTTGAAPPCALAQPAPDWFDAWRLTAAAKPPAAQCFYHPATCLSAICPAAQPLLQIRRNTAPHPFSIFVTASL